MISGAGLCWQHVGGVGSTTTTTTIRRYGWVCSNRNKYIEISTGKSDHCIILVILSEGKGDYVLLSFVAAMSTSYNTAV